MINKKPEILAPCGNPVAFRAALSAGADAVYLAANRFGARAYAGNFNDNELLQTLEEAHLHDMKVYLTLNTLLKDEETETIPDLMDPLYREGLDACLVQDLGVASFLKDRYPKLPLHASTQMNLCSVYGASYAKALGFTRVVPARELTLEELIRIKKEAGIEVEAFVHGAMCVCYSGRCYLSSFVGGRSGNRGRCAQPCRWLYGDRYALSMKDLCTLESVPRLMEAGIDSLKIEGRMKNEYYVAACVDAYKQMVDDCMRGDFSEQRAKRYKERLAEIFHRGGFTGGYLFSTGDPSMLDEKQSGHAGIPIGNLTGIGKGEVRVKLSRTLHAGDSLEIPVTSGKAKQEEEPVRLTSPTNGEADQVITLRAPKTGLLSKGLPLIRTKNALLTEELEEKILNRERKLPIRMEVLLRADAPFTVMAYPADTGEDTGCCGTAMGPVPEKASGRPVSDEVIREKTGTLSDTGYRLESLTIENDGDLFIPASLIKKLRREALDSLREQLLGRYRRELPYRPAKGSGLGDTEAYGEPATPARDVLKQENFLRIIFISELSAMSRLPMDRIDAVVFDLGRSFMDPDEIRKLRKTTDSGVRFLVGFPYIYRNIIPEDRMQQVMELAEELDGVYLNGIDAMALYLEKGKKRKVIFLGAALYAYNSGAAEHFYEAVQEKTDEIWMEAPYELSEKEIRSIRIPKGARRITTCYGHLPMMITMQRGYREKEALDCPRIKNLTLYRNTEMCYNLVLSNAPVLQDAGSGDCAYHITDENEETVAGILSGDFSGINGIRHHGLL